MVDVELLHESAVRFAKGASLSKNSKGRLRRQRVRLTVEQIRDGNSSRAGLSHGTEECISWIEQSAMELHA